MIVVADASPLIALTICDSLPILEGLFDEVKVSQAVYDEVSMRHKSGSEQLIDYLKNKVVQINLDDYIIDAGRLDKGELCSMALYKRIQADYLLIDEKIGRKIAKINDINVIGSLGVLVEAKKKGLILTLKPCVDTLRASKIYFSDSLLDYVLDVVGE